MPVPAGSPSQPNVDKITKNSVDLSWTRPTSDGGSKLTGYVVEKKKKGEEWMECAHVPASATSATVAGLQEGDEYQFRVRAENAAGPGDASKPTSTITVADQPGERLTACVNVLLFGCMADVNEWLFLFVCICVYVCDCVETVASTTIVSQTKGSKQ